MRPEAAVRCQGRIDSNRQAADDRRSMQSVHQKSQKAITMFWRRKRRLTEETPKEPLFTAVRSGDEEMQRAYGLAAGSIY